MADDYDPSDPPTFDGADSYDPSQEYDGTPQEIAGDEDDDYEPVSFNEDHQSNDDDDSSNAGGTPQNHLNQTAQPPKPKIVGGFLIEESDDEQGDIAPPPSQPNGSGAVARAEAQDISLHSAPQDTATSSKSLHGSNTIPVPSTSTPIPSASPNRPLSANQGKLLSTVSNTGTPAASQSDHGAFAPPPVAQNTITTSQGPARLPYDKVGQLEDRIRDDPKGDADAWLALISHYYDKGQYEFARNVYQRLLEVFPTAAPLWVKYLKMENELDEREKVEGIFTQCLLQITDVDMCSMYLDHLRRIMPLMNDTSGQHRATITSAFDLVLDQVGIDPDAGKLWREYIDFIKDSPGTIKASSEKDATWQDAQKLDILRKAYQRAFKFPHTELVRLWKEYETLEMSVHKGNARKNMSEQSPHYMQSRAAKVQLDQKLEGLDRQSLPRLPPLYGYAGEDEFGTQVELWRDWISWEKEDPLLFKGEDDAELGKRIVYVYKQAVKGLAFYPPMWFEAASWCFSQGSTDMTTQGEQFLEKGIASNPESVLLAMMKADRIESSLEAGNTDEILIRNGERLDEPYEGVHTSLYALRKKMQEKEQKAIGQIQEHFASLPQEEDSAEVRDEEEDEDGSPNDKPPTREMQLKAQIAATKAASEAHMEIIKHTISYVWVAKMRAFRRIQGQGMPQKKAEAAKPSIKGFRGVFSDARPRGALTSDVYIASALMEWHCYRDPSAIKIFERGMKLFPTDEVFILEYIKHLIAENDVTNARVVFESTIPKIQGSSKFPIEKQRHKCRLLFAYMHEFESKYGDLAQIHKLERRMAELYPGEPDIDRFSHRFALPTFDAISEQLLLSPTQALPKPIGIQSAAPVHAAISIEEPKSPQVAEILLGPNGPYVASPKRPLEDSDSEMPQRKFMRGDSPTKGTAGVRIQMKTAGGNTGGSGFATKTYIPPGAPGAAGPSPLPLQLEAILRVLPNAAEYQSARLDPAKLAAFLVSVNVEQARALHSVGQLNRR